MNDLSSIPVRIPLELDPRWPSDDCCDQCCTAPVREVIDGDKLCQSCADKWARNEAPGFEDDLLPVDHPAMRESYVKWNDARVSDERLRFLSKGQRHFERSGR